MLFFEAKSKEFFLKIIFLQHGLGPKNKFVETSSSDDESDKDGLGTV